MRRQTTGSPARRRRLTAVLLATLVLTLGTACSWGDDSASGGDTAQTDGGDSGSDGGSDGDGGDGSEDGGGDGDGGGGGGSGGDGDDTGGGGSKGSPIELARATEQVGSDPPVPVGLVAEQAADQMDDVCPGGTLCVEIDIQPDDGTCLYAGSDPDPNNVDVINVGATLTLFGDCDTHLEPDPENAGAYRVVGGGEVPDDTEEEPTDGTEEEPTEGTEEEPTEGTDGAPPEDDQG